MKRIVVIGNAAAGKSTLAVKINKITNIPIFHLDKILWKKNWERTAEEEFIAKHDEIIRKDSWIVDGVAYKSSYPKRFSRADTIIFLDTPLKECKQRSLQRMKEDIDCPNPYVTEGCRYPLEFIKEAEEVIVLFHKEYREYILEMLKEYANDTQIIILKSDVEVENFLQKIKK